MDDRTKESDRTLVATNEATVAAGRLDQHHSPETNGRMCVCRRCGVATDGPAGLHRVPNERSLKRGQDWLEKEQQRERIGRFSSASNT